jgi:hypothetical protein
LAKNSPIRPLAVLMPCISFFNRNRKREATVCFFLQATLIGWVPASVWAYSSISEEVKKRRIEKVLRSVRQYKVMPVRRSEITAVEKNSMAEMTY